MQRWLILLVVAACGKSDECVDYAKHVADVTGVPAGERKIVEDGLRSLCKDGDVSAANRKCQMAAKDKAALEACFPKPPPEPAPPAATGTTNVKLGGFKNLGDTTPLAAESKRPHDQTEWLDALATKVAACGGKEPLAPANKWVQVTYGSGPPIVMPEGGLPPTVKDCIMAVFETQPSSITDGSIEFTVELGK